MTKEAKQESEKIQGDGWTLDSAYCEAKIVRAWMEDGEQRTKQQTFKGTSEEVQNWIKPSKPGEQIELQNAHFWEEWSREGRICTIHGMPKERETKRIQGKGFGSNLNPTTPVLNKFKYSSLSKEPIDECEEPQFRTPKQGGTDRVDYLKNLFDIHMADHRTEKNVDNSQKLLMAICIAAALVGLAFLAAKVLG